MSRGIDMVSKRAPSLLSIQKAIQSIPAIPRRKNGRPDYQIDGHPIPSLTQVIGANNGWGKDALVGWANKIGRLHQATTYEYLQHYAGAGSLAHALVEQYLKGHPVKISYDGLSEEQIKMANSSFENFTEFFSHLKFRLVASELILISNKWHMGTTIDIVGLMRGELLIIEIKTSDAIREDHECQVTLHKDIWDENFPKFPIDNTYLIQISREDASYSWHKVGPNVQRDMLQTFYHWRSLHDFKLKREKKPYYFIKEQI